MELEEDDKEEGTQTYTHKCNFNEDEVKEYLQEVMSSEYIKNYFDEEEFEKHYTIMGRDEKEGIYQFIDEWSNCYYLIKNNTVYHLSPFKEEIYCFHCENNEEVKFDEESLGYYQICLTLTRHVDKFINMIRKRTTLAASVSHEERYADDIKLTKEEEKEENNETPQERLQRALNEIPTNNEREHQLIKDLKHKLKDRIEKPIQEHVFRIKEDNNKVSLSLEGIMLSMSDGGYDINFYDELFVIKLNENGRTIQYLNEIMLKDIESLGFWFGENNEKLTEAIKEAEDTFNNFVMKKP